VLDRVGLWPLRVLWASLPVTAGAALADALGDAEATFGRSVGVGLWVLWAATLLALLVPLPATLTVVRLVVPAAPLAVGWAMVGHDGEVLGLVGLVSAALAAGLVVTSATADAFVDGASYGSERRFVLRAPVALLLGPLPGAWLVAVSGAVAGPLLLAGGEVWWGAAVTVVGWPVAALAVRALHGLSRRWLVFVPNGLVVHDPFTLGAALPLLRQSIVRIGAAPMPGALRAPAEPAPTFGIRLVVQVDPPVRVPALGTAVAEWVEVDEVIVAPARPGRVLAEAESRRLPVGD
jgi:hypothetical protein